jgi:integrase
MLTDLKIRTAKAGVKEQKLYDELGLFLLIKPSGNKLWRFRYQFNGKEKLISLGCYPDVTLLQARKKRSDARELLLQGVDPSEERQQRKQEAESATLNTFAAIANEWMATKGVDWSDSHRERNERLLLKDLAVLSDRPIKEIKATELLAAIRKIEMRGAVDTAHRARQSAGMVFRFAIATGRADRDVAHDLKGALKAHKKRHYSAVTELPALKNLLLMIDNYHGYYAVRIALQLAPLFFIRPGVLIQMEWNEINWEKKEWRVPALKMKADRDHIVPLASQAVDILREQQCRSGHSRFVFPSVKSTQRCLSDGALRIALRTMGIEKEIMTPHGFRATARTILDEELGIRPDLIEHQLAHRVKDPNGRAYNRTSFLLERKEMMQAWADYLAALKSAC